MKFDITLIPASRRNAFKIVDKVLRNKALKNRGSFNVVEVCEQFARDYAIKFCQDNEYNNYEIIIKEI